VLLLRHRAKKRVHKRSARLLVEVEEDEVHEVQPSPRVSFDLSLQSSAPRAPSSSGLRFSGVARSSARDSPAVETTTTETLMEWYSNPAANLVKIVDILSYILPVHAEEYLAIFTSKNLARRAIIIEVAGGGKVTTCAGHSAACSARSAAASLWVAVDQTSPWTAIPADPRRGSGCPFYHKCVTRALMNKKKMDLREGRGSLSAQLVWVWSLWESSTTRLRSHGVIFVLLLLSMPLRVASGRCPVRSRLGKMW
jgi:hypothetical protein